MKAPPDPVQAFTTVLQSLQADAVCRGRTVSQFHVVVLTGVEWVPVVSGGSALTLMRPWRLSWRRAYFRSGRRAGRHINHSGGPCFRYHSMTPQLATQWWEHWVDDREGGRKRARSYVEA